MSDGRLFDENAFDTLSRGRTQTERVLYALAPGRWVPRETLISMRIPDYRRRICDLRDAGHPIESRTRSRGTYRMKDDRYTGNDEEIKAGIRRNLPTYRECSAAGRPCWLAFREAVLTIPPGMIDGLTDDLAIGTIFAAWVEGGIAR